MKDKSVYLNNAEASYPKPGIVVKRVLSVIKNLPDEKEQITRLCRETVSGFINSPAPESIVLTPGATYSINLAIQGLKYPEPFHVVTTAAEHNAVYRPLYARHDRGEIDLSVVPCDRFGRVDPEGFIRALRNETKLIVINHISNITGFVQDLEKIIPAVKDRGALILVDATQSAGILPIDVQELGADFLAFSGYKYLFGTEGAGILYIRPGLELSSHIMGGSGNSDESPRHPENPPYKYEAGSKNRTALASLTEGINFIERTGIQRIGNKIKDLRNLAYNRLKEIPGLIFTSAEYSGQPSPVLSFYLSGQDPGDTADQLGECFGINVKSGISGAPLIHSYLGTDPKGIVRISLSWFTAPEDIEFLALALRTIQKNLG